jgi:hypothetical protein
MSDPLGKGTFGQIANELGRLQRRVQDVRELPRGQLHRVLRLQTQSSCARADALIRRIVELRELIDVRRRRLERLRARMHQIRGGARPH